MDEWKVIENGLDASSAMALDEMMLGEDENVLHIYDLDEPAMIMAWRTSFEDIKPGNRVDYTRRKTDGSTIPCQEDAITFSVTYNADHSTFPTSAFESDFAPSLTNTLVSTSKLENTDLRPDNRHFYIRHGDYSTPEGISEGLPLIGSAARKAGDRIQFQCIVPVEAWSEDFVAGNMKLSEGQRDLLEELPYMEQYDASAEEIKSALVERFAGTEYEERTPDYDEVEARRCSEFNREWIEHPGHETVSGQGHCFMNEKDGNVY